MKKAFQLVLVIIFMANYAVCQDSVKVLSLTLKEAQEYALNHSYEVKNAQIDIAKSIKKIWETTAIGLPNFDMQVSYQRIFEVPTMDWQVTQFKNTVSDVNLQQIRDSIRMETFSVPMELGSKSTTTIDFTISQLIFSGEYIVGLQASKTYRQLSERSLIKIKYDVVENVTKTYYLVLTLRENLNTLKESLEIMEQTAFEMEKMYQAGFIEDTDVDQIKLTLTNLKNTLSSLNRQLEVSEMLFNFQIGTHLKQKVELADRLQTFLNQVNFEAIIQSQLQLDGNIDYQLMETQEKLQELNLKREQSTVLPTLSAFYRHQEQINAPDFNFSTPDVIGLSINIPVFASGSRYAKIQQQKMELEKIRNSKLLVADGLKLEYNQARSEMMTAYEKYQNEEESMGLAKKIYDKTVIKYKEGISSSMDLTQAQNQYLQSQSNYYNAILELLNSQVKLEKILKKNELE